MKTELGQKVKDSITGFAGIVTGRAEYITGCHQILVQPPVKNAKDGGDFQEPHWFDEDRAEVIDPKQLTLPRTSPGFDKPAPVR